MDGMTQDQGTQIIAQLQSLQSTEAAILSWLPALCVGLAAMVFFVALGAMIRWRD